MSTNLSKLKSKQEFVNTAHTATPHPSNAAALSAAWSTLSLLRHSSCTPNQLGLLPSSVTLVASSSTYNSPSSGVEFIENLTHAAHATSESLACSSVLAGLSSESDEFGDVGILIPSPLPGLDREPEIVRLLGLEDWLHSGGQIVKIQESRDNLPSGLAQIPQTQRDTAGSQLDEFVSLLLRLNSTFEFRLENGEGTIVWLFLGQLMLGDVPVLAGLLGAGTWDSSQ